MIEEIVAAKTIVETIKGDNFSLKRITKRQPF